MSKIDTLINLINYQKQNPEANKKQTARGVGISPQYLIECLGEINLLKEHFTPSLDTDQIRFLLSELDRGNPYKKEIHRQLQEYLGPSPYRGILRTARPDEKPPPRGLTIGEFTRSTNGNLHPAIQFSLDRLCYDSLFWINRNGEIKWRLATAVEPADDFLTWIIALRPDLQWSDGKPIRRKDVIQTISESHLTKLIDEIKPDGKNRLRIQLTKAESTFLRHLASLPIRPSHSRQPYRVTSGAYRLKNSFSPKAITFRLVRNPDYYQERKGGIDRIIIKRFKHAARAITALLSDKIDLIFLDALQPLYQISNNLPLQQAPFFGEDYYLMFLNRRHGLLQDAINCHRLKETIDYRGISRYLHCEQNLNEETMKAPTHSSLNLKLIYSKEVSMARYVATLVGRSVRASVINPVFLEEDAPHNIREEADILLTRIYFGAHYNRLSQYFHSQGKNNVFGYATPQVDALLAQLDQTTDVAQREVIGQRVISILQKDYAIILLSPYFQYFLSPLEIQFDATLTSHADLIENMKHLVIERD